MHKIKVMPFPLFYLSLKELIASFMKTFTSFPRIALYLLLISVLVGSSSCTRPEDEDRIHFTVWGSVEQQRAEEEMVDAFRQGHPDTSVHLQVIGARYADVLQAMFVGNVAPDVVMVPLTQYDEWASRGVLTDLTELFHELDNQSEFLPIPRRAVMREGRAFGIPINAHGQATFYNQEALRAAGVEIPEGGLTWDFLEEIAPRLSARNGDPDAPTDYIMFLPNPSFIFWQFGAEFFDDLFHPTQVTINSSEAREALEFIRRMVKSGYAVPPEVASDEGTYQLFRDGRIAFYFNGRWMTPQFAGRTDFDWDVVAMPAGPKSNITGHGGTVLAVWDNSPRQEAARRFIRFYASPEGNKMSMQWQRNVPVYREVAYSEEFFELQPPENLVEFSRTMEDGAAQFALYAPGSAEVVRLVDARIQQALASPGMSSDQILNGLESDLTRWLERMQERGIL